ncbi:hypothetical protein NDU88_003076 [Pleurodeles waltl]|uniref:Uncharacterized protein n=1 Tax=Pleurodeles waltl TaxID=8319 RepID=A0AAV7VG70_PLEWA|nr:hypothetical protein NDU88_003076 [Pleurodeles waltl]
MRLSDSKRVRIGVLEKTFSETEKALSASGDLKKGSLFFLAPSTPVHDTTEQKVSKLCLITLAVPLPAHGEGGAISEPGDRVRRLRGLHALALLATAIPSFSQESLSISWRTSCCNFPEDFY